MPEPSPSHQVDAMREWLVANTTTHAIPSYSKLGIKWLIDVHYRGGVDQFIADHKEQGHG